MWLGLAILVLAFAGAIGGAFAGGIFTIVLIPLAVIALVAVLIAWLWGLATGSASASTTTKSTSDSAARGASSRPRSRGDGGRMPPRRPIGSPTCDVSSSSGERVFEGYAPGQHRELWAHVALMGLFASLSTAFATWFRRSGRELPDRS
jgi:hypothetical protein